MRIEAERQPRIRVAEVLRESLDASVASEHRGVDVTPCVPAAPDHTASVRPQRGSADPGLPPMSAPTICYETVMDAALVGLAGTTVGAVTGFAGAWLAQRGQLRIQQEQRIHAEQIRWLDDKKGLYRDLLIALYGWHDSLASILGDEDDGKLFDFRSTAHKWLVEASLIAGDEVRSAMNAVHRALLDVRPVIFNGSPMTDAWPLQPVQDGLTALEEALRAELAMPGRVGSRSLPAPRRGAQEVPAGRD